TPRLLFLRRGGREPPGELGRAVARLRAGDERLIVQFGTEIERFPRHNYRPRVFVILENLADEFVDGEGVRAGSLDRTSYRLCDGRLGDRSRDIFCRHRLEQRVRQAHCVTFDGRLRDATEELEELGGTDDCVWSGRVLDEALLRKFGAEITAVEQALGSDNR